jgi:hypothetical protein
MSARRPSVLIGVVIIGVFTFITIAQSQQPANDASKLNKPAINAPATLDCPEADSLRKNVQQLKGEVQRLNTKVARLEKDRLATSLQEQLEHEQEIGERLQLHLIEISEKEAPLLARMDQIIQLLRPEAMERVLAGVGSVHPEDVRDETRKTLTSERFRIQSQLELFRQDRMRTQASLATTDAAIQRLKQKLLEALNSSP